MAHAIFNTNEIGSLYCVGRNYAAHAQELNNPIPQQPVIFTKTRSSVCPLQGEIELPLALGRCDHETEIVVRLGQDLYQASPSEAINAISHYGLALDLTLREKQSELKQQSYPWDLAKSFINACPLSPLIPFSSQQNSAEHSLTNIDFSLTINGQTKQQGNSANMLFSIVDLIVFLSNNVPLMTGDLILTGTPAGVGPLHDGDQLTLTLNGQIMATATIVRS